MVAFAQNEPPYLTTASWLGIWLNTNSVVISSVMQSNRQNVSTETKGRRYSTAQTWDVCRPHPPPHTIRHEPDNHGLQGCIITWHGNFPARRGLQRVVRSAQHITRGTLPFLQDTYSTRCHRKAKKDNQEPHPTEPQPVHPIKAGTKDRKTAFILGPSDC